VIGTILTWAENVKTFVTEKVPEIIENIVQFFRELPEKIWEWLTNTIAKIATWAIQMQQNAAQAASDFISNVVTKIKELPGEVWSWLTNTIEKVKNFATDIGTKATEAAKNLWDNLVDGITGLPDKIYSIGSDIVEGLWNGINDMAGWIWDKIQGFGQGVLDGLRSFFDINSPSKVMADQIGKFLPMGMAEGIESKTKTAVNAMKKSAKKTLDAAKSAVANVSNDLNIGTNGIAGGNTSFVNNYTFNQTNNSPKALSRFDIYRQSKNLLAAKGV
jgi:phage-related protein